MSKVLLTDRFIIDGIHHQWIPGDFQHLGDQYGPHRQSYPTLALKNVVVIQTAPADTANTYINKRKVHRQAWQATWSKDSIMDVCMYNHLKTLYTLQKTFWMQYDDEMSRDGAVLETIGTDYKSWFTPTYPIVPFGHTPTAPEGYNGTVFVNKVAQYSGFTIDSEIGMVRFASAKASTDDVIMAYTWKSFVQIAKLDLVPQDLACTYYTGTVIFEQVTPDLSYDPWKMTLPCGYVMDNTGKLVWDGRSNYTQTPPSSYATIGAGDTRYLSGYSSNGLSSTTLASEPI